MISARSERQAMDWSLVLASQDIPTGIERVGDRQWVLVVPAGDHERALQSIRQYRLENRGWRWRKEVLGYDVSLHWGGVLWCVLLAVIYDLSYGELFFLQPAWILKSNLVLAGEWWRIFTAQLLHADLVHLLANVTSGCVLFGLALSRYGSGCGLLACLLAGASGNILGLIIHSKPYDGLGASGMVMGALGLISVPEFGSANTHPLLVRQWAKGAWAGAMLFVLLGLNPSSDVAAHLGGFAGGVLLGILLNFLPHGSYRGRAFNRICWFLMTALLGLAAWLSFRTR